MRCTGFTAAIGLAATATVVLPASNALAQENMAPAVAPVQAAPAPGAEPAPTAADPEERFPAAWTRIDSDLGGVQLWAGATHMVSDSVGIATDLYVNATGAPYLGELDIGPAFVAGPLVLTPMIGLLVDWSNRTAAALVPQFYATGTPDPFYFELWVQNYQYNVFNATSGANTLYFRFFVNYRLHEYLAIGPEVEATLGLNDAGKALFANSDTLGSLPVGVNVMLPNYGKGNTFFVFAGYETQDTPNDKRFAGRLTFVHNL